MRRNFMYDEEFGARTVICCTCILNKELENKNKVSQPYVFF